MDGEAMTDAGPEVSPLDRQELVGARIGRYVVLEEIGRGGMAVVFKARDEELGRLVALKVLSSEFTSDFAALQRFKREARICAHLDHPNIVKIYDIGYESSLGVHYFSMEYLPHRSLHELIKEQGRLPIKRALEIVKQTLKGLQVAHEAGIVHRDIKPENIMIAEGDRPVLVDFGIAKSQKGGRLTQTGILLGTPYYMSPEQITGKEVKLTSDIYSMGVVLFELVTANVPFQADSTFMITYKHCTQEPPDPRKFNEEVSEDLKRVIFKALEKDPRERYQSAAEMADDIERVQRGEKVTAELQEKRGMMALPSFKKAMAHFNNGDYEEAARMFASLADDEPLPPEEAAKAKRWQAECLEKQGRYEEAIAVYKQLLERWPDSSEAELVPTHIDACCFQIHALAEASSLEGDDEGALRRYESLVDTLVSLGIPLDNNVWAYNAREKALRLRSELERRRRRRTLLVWGGTALVSAVLILVFYFAFVDRFAWYALRARIAHTRGRYEEEIRLWDEALLCRPGSVEARLEKALALYRLGGHEGEVETLAEEILSMDPDAAEAHALKGRLLAGRGRIREAAEEFVKAVSLDGERPEWWSTLGALYMDYGRMDDALKCLQRAVQLDSSHASAYNNLGVWYMRMGRLEEAKACFRRALVLDSTNAAAHHNLGKALFMQAGKAADPARRKKLLELAEKSFEEALRYDPYLGDAHYHKALIASLRNDTETMLHELGRCIDVSPQHHLAIYQLARALAAAGRRKEALERAAVAVKLAPAEPRYLRLYGGLLYENGLYGRAVDVLRRCCRAGGADAATWLLFARALRAAGAKEESLEAYRKALEIGASEEAAAEAASLLLSMGAPRDALALLERIRAASGLHSPASWLVCAECLEKLGRTSEALSCYDRAMVTAEKLDASDVMEKAAVKASLLLARNDDVRTAERLLMRVLEKAPRAIGALNNLAYLLLGEGRYDEALALFERSLATDPLQADAARIRSAVRMCRERRGGTDEP